ncbi:hypothetical protein [uncultured Clostridium sp.]|jgi:hypothetical protein|uniref:hypothetical protein n=1 Tax=uncultured Clostridium sp. TaxID=59620 RepID=UPI0025D6008C|nr:hypothetical protein [uncultured Clostridium sp.]
MNRKYIIVSLSIFIVSLAFILGFNFILGDKVLYINSVDFDHGVPVINYVGLEEDENSYKIKISIKNNSNYYASFNNISLQFTGTSQGAPTFSGYDNDERKALINHKPGDKYSYSSFFGPNEEREYVFEVSKGISFDKEVFNSKNIDIGYSYQLYKYRVNNNTVIGAGTSGTGSKRIEAYIDIIR